MAQPGSTSWQGRKEDSHLADPIDRLRAALGGRYAITHEIGRGGMATVYLAEDLKHHRQVAIKVLQPELAAILGPERFLREIEIAAKLTHPRILPLHDSGEADGLLYYVMPYVPGESLRQRLVREKQLPVDEALQIADHVVSALVYAHGQGVVHRDIKPENILVHEGEALVADFGIALAAGRVGTERLTGTGLAVGTLQYMSPEQVTGQRTVDGRSDLYSLGCVLYEMLTGQVAFDTGPAAGRRETPLPPKTSRREVPLDLERVILRCVKPNVEARFQSAAELLNDLAACRARLEARSAGLGLLLSRPSVVAAIVGAGLVVVAAGGWLWRRESRVAWARTVALPEATRLIEQGNRYAAFRLLRQAEAYLRDDPAVTALLMESTTRVAVRTTPPGAQVYVRDFLDEPEAWESLGRTPLEGVRLPSGALVWKISLEGFQIKEGVALTGARNLHFTLRPAATAPADMVHLPGGRYELFSTRAVELVDYWVDKHEVTNRRFKEFIDGGGYETREFWSAPFVRDGRVLAWQDAQLGFRDRTGRPGPALWELGTYPDGQDDYPVGGVSWYEAAAFCASSGKQLPTIYHWYNAANLGLMTEYASLGNFSATGPERVGHPLRIGVNGTYDMAGNVKEWVWNEADANHRYILGGGWNELSYHFRDHDAQAALDRRANYGFRCATYEGMVPTRLTEPVKAPSRDYQRERPASPQVFAVYESLYRYDRLPVDAEVESVDDRAEHWRIERVSFAAAYGSERVPVLLFLPKKSAPPFQTVVYFPGANAFFEGSRLGNAEGLSNWFLFLVRSGRAVVVPAYRGSFERYAGNAFERPQLWRDVMIHASKDLGRTIDYLETRSDIDAQKLAYYGLSMGAGVGPIMTAVESRFEASVLLGGGLYFWRRPPESEAFTFLPRVTVPTLMINGRHDFFFPLETSQAPMFRLLGTAPADKLHRVFETGHVPGPWHEVMKEILDWLDRYLGPVSNE